MSHRTGVASWLAGAALLAAATASSAETAPSIEAVLNANAGKVVTLRLEGGEELSGTVSSLSPVTVKLTGLTGREYYDAVVRLDQIAAVIVRAPAK